MPTTKWFRTVAIATTGALLSAGLTGTAQSEPGARPEPPDIQAERSARPDKDLRAG